ncbi:MAG: general secretion pathway protein GspK [Puniceicoccales bacterium]|jgi:type II secretory pathway component PulK|nr:general secretion pathway protein GspK [Puniceicoccales bacterium]
MSGAILLMVLGLLMLLSFLVVIFLKNLTQDIKVHAQLLGNTDLKHHAYNGLNVVWTGLEEILEIHKNLFSPLQGWDKVISTSKIEIPEGIQLKVHIEDESGKIPLNNPDKRLLLNLFNLFGDYLDSQSLMQSYLQWLRRKPTEVTLIENRTLLPGGAPQKENATDKKAAAENKSESENPHGNKPPGVFLPTHLNNYRQLAEIESFQKRFFSKGSSGDEALKRLRECTTLLGSLPININTAPKDVWVCLSKIFLIDLEQVENFMGKTEQSQGRGKYYKSIGEINKRGHGNLKLGQHSSENKKDDTLHDVAEKFMDVSARILKVEVEVSRADVSYTLTAIFKVNKTPTQKQESKQPVKTLTNKKEAGYSKSKPVQNNGASLELVVLQEGRWES